MKLLGMNSHTSPLTGISEAKRILSCQHTLDEWRLQSPQPFISLKGSCVDLGGRLFQDNTKRIPGTQFLEPHGDNLPELPTVLTGLCDHWKAFERPGVSWSVDDLAGRTKMRLSLDGGPYFARMSMSQGKVCLKEYAEYCAKGGEAEGDIAPLYVFDPDILYSKFSSSDNIESDVASEYDVPICFSKDVMACLTGTGYRPLPPAWLLVGAERSGTPIHNHPYTVAWNALLVGCKLWCCLPPNVDESLLLYDLEDEDKPFEKSAIEWFEQIGTLPEGASIIVQQPGEVVYVPAGWYHVVLNVELSTAISVSLTLRKDLIRLFPILLEEDVDFAARWIKGLTENNGDFAKLVGVSVDDLTQFKKSI
jgi:histone arginine demethylase JMJD6